MFVPPQTQELFHVHIHLVVVVVAEFIGGMSEIEVSPSDVILVEIELKYRKDEHKALSQLGIMRGHLINESLKPLDWR